MILNSYEPSRPPYTSPEWTVDIEISVQSPLHPSCTFALFEGNLFSKTFNGNEPIYSNLIAFWMINFRNNVIINTQLLYFYFEKYIFIFIFILSLLMDRDQLF